MTRMTSTVVCGLIASNNRPIGVGNKSPSQTSQSMLPYAMQNHNVGVSKNSNKRKPLNLKCLLNMTATTSGKTASVIGCMFAGNSASGASKSADQIGLKNLLLS